MAGALLLPAFMCHGSVDFKAEILPVLESKCFKCHQAPFEKDGRTVKPKAGLRLDAAWAILAGGESGHPAVVAKNTAKSYVLEVVNLPKDDDLFMPPEGDPLTAQEITRFKTWIEEGADFGGWEGNLTGRPAGATVAQTDKEREHDLLYRRLSEGLTPVPLDQIKALKESAGAQVFALGAQGPLVRVDFLTGVTTCNDASVQALLPIRENIAHLDLARTKITDESLKVIARMPRLTRLDLRHTAITDGSLELLKGCKNLTVLNLFGSRVTDAAAAKLGALKSLQQVYVSETQITDAGLTQLRTALPEAEIVGSLKLPVEEKRQGGGAGGMRKRKKDR